MFSQSTLLPLFFDSEMKCSIQKKCLKVLLDKISKNCAKNWDNNVIHFSLQTALIQKQSLTGCSTEKALLNLQNSRGNTFNNCNSITSMLKQKCVFSKCLLNWSKNNSMVQVPCYYPYFSCVIFSKKTVLILHTPVSTKYQRTWSIFFTNTSLHII